MFRRAMTLSVLAAVVAAGAALLPSTTASALASPTPCAPSSENAPTIRSLPTDRHTTLTLIDSHNAPCPRAAALAVKTYRLRIRVLDRTGAPARGADSAAIIDLVTGDTYGARLDRGAGTIALPAGRYAVGNEYVTRSSDGTPGSSVITYLPNVTVDRDRGVTLDARTTHRVTVTIDRAGAEQIEASAFLLQRTAAGQVQAIESSDSPDLTTTAIYLPALPEASDVTADVHTTWTKNGMQEDSPYLYEINSTSHGISTDPSWPIRTADLARVSAHYNAEGVATRSWIAQTPTLPQDIIGATGLYGIATKVDMPSVRTEYYTPGAWVGHESMGSDLVGDADDVFGLQTYPTAADYRDDWNEVPLTAQFVIPAKRYGDDVFIQASLFTDTSDDGYLDTSYQGTTGMTELRDASDTVIASSSDPGAISATLSGGVNRYTLTTHAERAAAYSLYDTQQDIEWTFTSGHDESGDGTTLPLPTINYSVPIDEMGIAHGAVIDLDAGISTQPGTPKANADSLHLEVSYDDGATWTTLTTSDAGDGHRSANLTPPNRAAFVSLRASGRDADGNTITETLIRAFGVQR